MRKLHQTYQVGLLLCQKIEENWKISIYFRSYNFIHHKQERETGPLNVLTKLLANWILQQ